jgi:hypothetical protein
MQASTLPTPTQDSAISSWKNGMTMGDGHFRPELTIEKQQTESLQSTWMNPTMKNTSGTASEKRLSSQMNFKSPPTIRSQSGVLFGVIGGIVKQKPASVQGIDENGSTKYIIEAVLLPENLTTSSTMHRGITLKNSMADFEEFVITNTEFSFPVAWSLLQVRVVCTLNHQIYIF